MRFTSIYMYYDKMRYFIAKYRKLVLGMPDTVCLHYSMRQHIVYCANKLGGLIFVYLNDFLGMCDIVYIVALTFIL